MDFNAMTSDLERLIAEQEAKVTRLRSTMWKLVGDHFLLQFITTAVVAWTRCRKDLSSDVWWHHLLPNLWVAMVYTGFFFVEMTHYLTHRMFRDIYVKLLEALNNNRPDLACVHAEGVRFPWLRFAVVGLSLLVFEALLLYGVSMLYRAS